MISRPGPTGPAGTDSAARRRPAGSPCTVGRSERVPGGARRNSRLDSAFSSQVSSLTVFNGYGLVIQGYLKASEQEQRLLAAGAGRPIKTGAEVSSTPPTPSHGQLLLLPSKRLTRGGSGLLGCCWWLKLPKKEPMACRQVTMEEGRDDDDEEEEEDLPCSHRRSKQRSDRLAGTSSCLGSCWASPGQAQSPCRCWRRVFSAFEGSPPLTNDLLPWTWRGRYPEPCQRLR